jgi:hypothetical protein
MSSAISTTGPVNENGLAGRSQRLSLPARLSRAVVVTVAILSWCSYMVGPDRLPVVLLLTFAWASMTARQAMAERASEAAAGRAADAMLSLAGGQLLWGLAPALRSVNPEGWFWLPVALPPVLAVAGALLTIGWTLHPFVAGPRPLHGAQHASAEGALDTPVLGVSFFLVSGQLVFAMVACVSVIFHVRLRAVLHAGAEGHKGTACAELAHS